MADNDYMPPEENLKELGEFFASQYYGLLCGEPDQMHRFYAHHSTMIHVIDGNVDTSTTIRDDLDKIEEHLKGFNVDTVEIKSNNCLDSSFSLAILLVVMGSVKLKDKAICRDFVHTMYLAPHWKKNAKKRGYFILNDILHIITHRSDVRVHSKQVLPLKSQDIDPRFLSESNLPSPDSPVADNGNLDEAKVEQTDDLMSTMENRIEFPPLPRKQQPPRQRSFGPSVWKTPLAQVSESVGNANDTIDENTDAPKIEEPVIVQEEPSQKSDKLDDSALLITSSTSGGRGRGHNNSSERGSGDRNKGKEIKEPVVVQEEPSASALLITSSTSGGRGQYTSSERGSGDRNKGKEIKEPVVVQEEPSASALPTSSTSRGRGRGRGRNNSSKRGSGDRNKGKQED